MPRVVPKEERNSPFPTKSVLSRRYSLKSSLLWGKLVSQVPVKRKGPYTIIFIPHSVFNIGFSVPKRFYAKADNRNRIKRFLRQASESLLCQYDTLPKAAIIVKYGDYNDKCPSLDAACHSLEPFSREVNDSIKDCGRDAIEGQRLYLSFLVKRSSTGT